MYITCCTFSRISSPALQTLCMNVLTRAWSILFLFKPCIDHEVQSFANLAASMYSGRCRHLRVSVLLLPQPRRWSRSRVVRGERRPQGGREVGWPLVQARHCSAHVTRLVNEHTRQTSSFGYVPIFSPFCSDSVILTWQFNLWSEVLFSAVFIIYGDILVSFALSFEFNCDTTPVQLRCCVASVIYLEGIFLPIFKQSIYTNCNFGSNKL